MAKKSDEVKMADVSLGHLAKQAGPRFICRLLHPEGIGEVTAHLPDGQTVVFKDGEAEITLEQAGFFSDTLRFQIKVIDA